MKVTYICCRLSNTLTQNQNFAGHEVLTHYILVVMEDQMPPSPMSYRHLTHRNSTKEIFKTKNAIENPT